MENKTETTEQMTVSDVAETCRGIAQTLQLGPGSYRWGSLYYDYGVVEFACFADKNVGQMVEGCFKRLLKRFGWECLRVTVGDQGRNAVIVTFHKSNIIDTKNEARMPYGLTSRDT